MHSNNILRPDIERNGPVDWLSTAVWLAGRYEEKPKAIKAAFRKCGLPASTGYALVGIGRRARACSETEREKLRQIGAAKARLVVRASDRPLADALHLATGLTTRDLAKRLFGKRD